MLRRIRVFFAPALAVAPEIVLSAALLAGWAAVTWGLAGIWGLLVWRFSAGILLLSLCGWKFLGVLFREGLYNLSRAKRGGS